MSEVPPTFPQAAAQVEDRLGALEVAGPNPAAIEAAKAELAREARIQRSILTSAAAEASTAIHNAERMARMETKQEDTASTLVRHEEIHKELTSALTALVGQFTKIKQQLFIATVVLFAGTSNGGKLASVVGHLLG